MNDDAQQLWLLLARACVSRESLRVISHLQQMARQPEMRPSHIDTPGSAVCDELQPFRYEVI
jgi:hypothetical protein